MCMHPKHASGFGSYPKEASAFWDCWKRFLSIDPRERICMHSIGGGVLRVLDAISVVSERSHGPPSAETCIGVWIGVDAVVATGGMRPAAD